MESNPEHIGIILDGNRRFSKRLMLEPWKGHEYGAKKVSKLFDWCKELDIKELTLYMFSMQNFNRPEKEFNFLMKLFKEFFQDQNHLKTMHDNKIKVKFIGRIHLFPKEVHESMVKLMEETKDYDQYHVNFAMAYGGREEVIDGIKKLANDLKENKISIEKINEESFSPYLYLQSEPDLIIRTGGDHRTSNFLIWQSWYSEWFFLDKFWPEFEKEDLIKIIKEFSQRERRFGK
ncbi:MAG: polyprenyl diphosphate synthase [archaeon]|nr:polyprenyl diphosphate synthase [archaeon]